MEHSNTKILSPAAIATHESIQAQKCLQIQLNALETERNLLKLILNDLHSHSQDQKPSIGSISSRLRSYSEYDAIQMQTSSYEQLNINELLIDICEEYRLDLQEANIEIYLENVPKLLGAKTSARALFANLYKFSILDMTGANSIHVEFETSKTGNRLLWEIGLEPSNVEPTQSNQSTFLILAKQLAPALGAKLSMYRTKNQVVIELLIDRR